MLYCYNIASHQSSFSKFLKFPFKHKKFILKNLIVTLQYGIFSLKERKRETELLCEKVRRKSEN
jgi:hypothetical protein